ncbi:protein of unknown function [Streptomyces sp. SolWspMP-5a-2]|nr:protein of unknown function [Streptomyces sp. SolWspMP-5a-2]
MTERKPPGVPFESWVDRQIRDGARRGGFDGLAGAGKPLPAGSDTSYDELWWIKEKMAREGLSVLPPTLALRKEAEDTLAEALAAPSERVVRALVGRINTRLLAMMLRPPPGPPAGNAALRRRRGRGAVAGAPGGRRGRLGREAGGAGRLTGTAVQPWSRRSASSR